MIIYSKKIIQFVDEIKRTVKDILSKEVGLRVATHRFYDRKQRASYPIHIVIYSNKSMLGYFDPNFYEMGFNECLMISSKEQLHNVIRHEIAHYITFIEQGEPSQPHPPEFRSFCERMGWGEEVYRATMCLDSGLNHPEAEENSVFRKVQKLMALTNSSNKNEAEAAIIKSQQLLLKHNIASTYVGGDEEERMCLKRIMKQKKENAKMRAIATILSTFFVSTVYTRGGGFVYLEILGTSVNVDIAEHVAIVLDSELDKLWLQAQKQANLKGMIAKNSFFLGLAKGYCNKIQALKRDYDGHFTNALIVIEKKLVDAKALVYPRLSISRSQATHCRKSSALGELMGRSLNINPAINRSSNGFAGLLGFFRAGKTPK
jgi:hypothetical protein